MNNPVSKSGMKWDYVLNHHYVPKDQKDNEEYENDIKQKGFKNSYSFLDDKYKRMYPDEAKRVIDSWERIFDINDLNVFEIQANLWEIKKEWVKDVLFHGDEMPEKYFLIA